MAPAPQPGNRNQNSSGAARKPQAADLFRYAQPWRFARPDDGRKYRVVRERLRRLARILARFDRSGNCRQIFPSVTTITAQLNAAELNYPEGQRFKWSRPTVFRYLDRLKRGGVATSGGLSHYHGTRRRVLHSDRLLSVPLESETPTPANVRQELNPRSLKIHKTPGRNRAENPRDTRAGFIDQTERRRRADAKRRRLEYEARGVPRNRNRRQIRSELQIGTGPRGDICSGTVEPVDNTAEIVTRAFEYEAAFNAAEAERRAKAADHDAWMKQYKRVVCPDCGASVLRWALEDGLHEKHCSGRATSP